MTAVWGDYDQGRWVGLFLGHSSECPCCPDIHFQSRGGNPVRLLGMVALRAPVMDGQDRDQAPVLETAFLSPYPNPFNPAVNLRFQLKEGGAVDLSLYDVRGRLVRHLVSEFAEKGSHVVGWNGRDEGGQAVASGVYLARRKAAGVRFTRRLLLVR